MSLVLLLLLPQGAFGSLHLAFTLSAVFVAQTILALPYIVALTPAAIQGLPPGLLAQARALGAGRLQLSLLALREAKIGVFAAVIAALGSALAEVGAVIIVGGNIQNYDQTLASAALAQVNDYANYPYAMAIGIVLLALILILTAVADRCSSSARAASTCASGWGPELTCTCSGTSRCTRAVPLICPRRPEPVQRHLVHDPGRGDRDRRARP